MKEYTKVTRQKMYPYVADMNMSGIQVPDGVVPSVGGMIAVNTNDPKDSWYISEAFMSANYVEVADVTIEETAPMERLVEEHKKLKDKHNKLGQFLLTMENVSSMDVTDWNMLCVQRDIMEAYIGIMEARMTKLNIKIVGD